MDNISKKFITKLLDDPECESRLDAGNYDYAYSALQNLVSYEGPKSTVRKVVSDFTVFLLESDVNPLEGQTLIRPYTFCGDLTSVSLPDIPSSVEEIRVSAYKNVVSSDKVIIIPGTVNHVDSAAFDTLDNIETIIFEDGAEFIATGAIKDCKNLTTVEIPSSLKVIYHIISAEHNIRKNITIKFNGTSEEFIGKLGMPNSTYFKSFKEVLDQNNNRIELNNE